MEGVWQVQEAKNRFSEVIACAVRSGPQTVTRHGRPVVRVVAVEPAVESPGSRRRPVAADMPADDGFAQFLLSAPRVGELPLPPRRGRKPPPDFG